VTSRGNAAPPSPAPPPAAPANPFAPIQRAIAASYAAVRANTACASSRRSVPLVAPPLARISPSTRPYCAGSVTTVTLSKFFAALRSIDGPPMSTCSTASCSAMPARATVASKG
jgi:hypothetical protein